MQARATFTKVILLCHVRYILKCGSGLYRLVCQMSGGRGTPVWSRFVAGWAILNCLDCWQAPVWDAARLYVQLYQYSTFSRSKQVSASIVTENFILPFHELLLSKANDDLTMQRCDSYHCLDI